MQDYVANVGRCRTESHLGHQGISRGERASDTPGMKGRLWVAVRVRVRQSSGEVLQLVVQLCTTVWLPLICSEMWVCWHGTVHGRCCGHCDQLPTVPTDRVPAELVKSGTCTPFTPSRAWAGGQQGPQVLPICSCPLYGSALCTILMPNTFKYSLTSCLRRLISLWSFGHLTLMHFPTS